MKPIIFIGNTQVDIGTSEIPVVIRSPLFVDEQNKGSFIFNFTVPLSDDLKKELEFIHRPGAPGKIYYHDLSIKYGKLFFSGTAKIIATSPTQVEVSMAIFNGSLADKMKDILLTEIETETIDKIIPNYARASLNNDVNYYQERNYPESNIPIQLNFPKKIDDPDQLFSLSGDTFVCPQSGDYYAYIAFEGVINYGICQSFIIKVNGIDRFVHTIDYRKGLSFLISEKLILNQGDQVTFFFLVAVIRGSSSIPGPDRDPDDLTHTVDITLHKKSLMAFFSKSVFDDAVNLFYPSSNFATGPIYNDQFYSNSKKTKYEVDDLDLQFLNEKFPIINYYENNCFPILLTREEQGDVYNIFNTISPLLYLPYIIEKLFNHVDIQVKTNDFTDPDIDQVCVYANNSVNRFDIFAQNAFKNILNLSILLPELKAIEFFVAVCKTMGIAFHYNHQDNSIELKSIYKLFDDFTSTDFSSRIISRPSISVNTFSGFKIAYAKPNDKFLSDFFKNIEDVNYLGSVAAFHLLPNAETDDCFFVEAEQAFFVFGHDETNNTLNWQLFSLLFDFEFIKQLIDYLNDNVLDISLPAVPMMMLNPHQDLTWGAIPRKWIIPGTRLPGKIGGLKKPDPSYYLLWYRGLQPDSNLNSYPLLSNGCDNLFQTISLDHPLEFNLTDNPDSLLSKRFKKYLYWRVLNDGEHTILKAMSPEELANFDFFKWYNIMGADYLITELKFSISKSGLSAVEISAVQRINYQE